MEARPEEPRWLGPHARPTRCAPAASLHDRSLHSISHSLSPKRAHTAPRRQSPATVDPASSSSPLAPCSRPELARTMRTGCVLLSQARLEVHWTDSHPLPQPPEPRRLPRPRHPLRPRRVVGTITSSTRTRPYDPPAPLPPLPPPRRSNRRPPRPRHHPPPRRRARPRPSPRRRQRHGQQFVVGRVRVGEPVPTAAAVLLRIWILFGGDSVLGRVQPAGKLWPGLLRAHACLLECKRASSCPLSSSLRRPCSCPSRRRTACSLLETVADSRFLPLSLSSSTRSPTTRASRRTTPTGTATRPSTTGPSTSVRPPPPPSSPRPFPPFFPPSLLCDYASPSHLADARPHVRAVDSSNPALVQNNALVLTLTENGGGTRVSTTRTVLYGTIQASIKTVGVPGVVTAFITMVRLARSLLFGSRHARRV